MKYLKYVDIYAWLIYLLQMTNVDETVILWSKCFIQKFLVLTVKVAESEIVFATKKIHICSRSIQTSSHTYADPSL